MKKVAEETWKQGFLHLTVDGEGLVSLWDSAEGKCHGGTKLGEIDSYLKLPLTPEQQAMIEATMKKNGHTP